MPLPPAFLFDPRYLTLAGGGVGPAILMAWFEHVFAQFPPGTHQLQAPISYWRICGQISREQLHSSIDRIGFRYQSTAEFQAMREAGREMMHPYEPRFVYYVMLRSHRLYIDLMIRNSALIESRMAALSSVPIEPSTVEIADMRVWF
jgi:hypothetical protein